jgi:hypothetical protein
MQIMFQHALSLFEFRFAIGWRVSAVRAVACRLVVKLSLAMHCDRWKRTAFTFWPVGLGLHFSERLVQ